MSVLIPDLKVYNEVFKKAWSYQFNRVCDINYCHTLSTYSENELKNWIYDLLWLNELSYLRRYEEEENVPELQNFCNLSVFGDTCNTYQMLKHLECIHYNIEIETITDGYRRSKPLYKITIPYRKMQAYKILCNAIDEIKSVIINEIEEYKNAKYAEV